MDRQLFFIFGLTFVINLIATLAYSVRIAGTRTGRIAVSLSLFNILVLVSRTSNTFQAPLLSKRVEHSLLMSAHTGITTDLRWLLFASTLATVTGALLIPTFQRVFGRAVLAFGEYRSVFRLLSHGFSRAGLNYLAHSARLPKRENLTQLSQGPNLPMPVILFNIVATAVSGVGVFASLYAGYLHPSLRLTASSLAGIINGLSMILLAVFIDPYLSILSDDVVEGKVGEPYFRKAVVWLVGSRMAGTVLAQAMLIPAAYLIIGIAERI